MTVISIALKQTCRLQLRQQIFPNMTAISIHLPKAVYLWKESLLIMCIHTQAHHPKDKGPGSGEQSQ